MEILRDVCINVESASVELIVDGSLFTEELTAFPEDAFAVDRSEDKLVVNQAADIWNAGAEEPVVRLRLPVDSILSRITIRTEHGEVYIDCQHPDKENDYGLLTGKLSVSVTDIGGIAVWGIDVAGDARLEPRSGDVTVENSRANMWSIPRQADRITDDANIKGEVAYLVT